MSNHNEISSFIWNVCDDVLRGLFKQHEYGDVILPFVVLRRLDCVLEGKKDDIIKVHEEYKDKFDDTSKIIHSKLNLKFSNYSRYDLRRLKDEPNKLSENFYDYLSSFSTNVQDIIQNFGLQKHIDKLESNNKLYLLIEKFTEIDLHPSNVDNHVMGNIFEELLRKFSEMSNETSGEHYTPRDVVKLLVSLVFLSDKEKLSDPNKIISVYDPCCGTGGMLTIGKDWIHENINKDVDINLFGQELNPQTYSICKSDFLITDEEPDHIKLGSSLTNDQHFEGNRKFDYMITNPPYGVSWKSEKKQIENESQELGGRFSFGLPTIRDGQLLFLQHMISKMERQGSRIGVVFNGSPLFTGDSGSGDSEIRKWLIEKDLLECIVSLPDNLFFNTPISTYILIVNNKKEPRRKGKIQLIDGSLQYNKMIMSLGEKRKYIDDSQKDKLLQTYIKFEESEYSKIFDNEFFGYTRVNIEQPIKENGVIKYKKDGTPKPDTNLRGYERIPLSEDIETFYSREVKPHLPDSWIDFSKNKVGYEIPFTKYFYREKPLRSSKKITYDLLGLDNEPLKLFKEVLNNQNIKRIRLENVVDLIKRPIKREDDKKYTKIGMYNWGRGIFKYPSELGSELGDSSFNFIKEGDLLLSGQFSWEGSVSMVGKEVDNCISSHRFHILKGKENILLNEYLWSYFRSQEGHFLLTENSFGSSGRNQPLNIGKLLKEKIPVPDISIQKEICRLVQQIISFDKYSKQRLGLLNEYRQSVITELLTGTRKVED